MEKDEWELSKWQLGLGHQKYTLWKERNMHKDISPHNKLVVKR